MRQNVNAYKKDRKCYKIVQANGLSVNALECTAQNNLIFAFALDSIIIFAFFYSGRLINEVSLIILHLMILEADLFLLVLKRGNLFDENY